MNTEAPKKPSWVKSTKGRIGLAFLTLAGLGGGAIIADQQGLIEIPGIHQNVENNLPVYPTFVEVIDQAALDHALGKDGTPLDQLPSSQIITAAKTIFRPDTNGITVSQEELSTLLQDAVRPPNEKTKTADISLLFPIKGPVNQNILVENIAYCSTSGRIGWERTFTIPTKGSEIIVPVDGAEVFRATPRIVDGKSYFTGILIRFTGPDNTEYELVVRPTGGVQSLSFDSILPALQDAPEIGVNGLFSPFDPKFQDIKGKSLSAGTSVLKTINNNAGLSFSLRVNKNGTLFPTSSSFDFLQQQQKNIFLFSEKHVSTN